MKINKSDLMSDELGKYAMVNGQKQYVVAKKKKLDINADSNVGRAEYNGNANIGMDYIKPAEDTITNLPKELPGGGPNINVSKSNAYNTYRPKPPQGVQGGGFVPTVPEVKSKEEIVKQYGGASYEPGMSMMSDADKIKPSVNTPPITIPTIKEDKREIPAVKFAKNLVGGALDSATAAPAVLGTLAAKGIGETAKFFGANPEKTDKYVKSFGDELSSNRGSFVGEDTNSPVYKGTSYLTSAAQIAAPVASIGGKVKGAFSAAKGAGNMAKNISKVSADIAKQKQSIEAIKQAAAQQKEYARLLKEKKALEAFNKSKSKIGTFFKTLVN